MGGLLVLMGDKDELYTRDEQRWSQLMANAQQGNQQEYQQLLTDLGQVIQQYLYSRIGRHDFIEDCVQECLISLHNARHTYDCHRKFRPWFFAIVKNKAIDHLRKQQSFEKNRRETVATQEQTLEQLERSLTQGQLINALNPDYRKAITLTKILGFSHAEAAQQLCISESAVKVRVHRAIGQLKTLFAREEI